MHTPQLTGRVLHPGDPGWDGARIGFALWAKYDENVPRVIVFCQNTQDVENAVRWATHNSVPIRIRSGRHNYEAFSSLVKDGIIIDVSEMEEVHVDSQTETAKVGAGIDMLQCFEMLGESGVTVPMATGPSVGLGGLCQGGGFGVTSRKWGLTCDNVTEFEIVTADGHAKTVNEHHHSDLFWAVRGGGGGNFGVVTSFTFKTHKIGNVAIFSIDFPWANFDNVVNAWQNWAFEAPDGLSTFIALLTTRNITLQGQFTPDSDAELPLISEILAPMLALGPTSVNLQMLPAVIATRVVLGVDPLNPTWRVQQHSDNQLFKSTSAIANKPFSMDTIKLMRNCLENCPPLSAPPSQPSMIQLLSGGGQMNRVPQDATAVYFRDAHFAVQYDGYWTAPQDGPPTIDWTENTRNALSPYTVGAYVNYSDTRITNYLEQYYGPHLPKLVQVKQKYDPANVFTYPQGIPLSL